MQLDGTSELYSNERTYSTSLCARHRQLEGMSHLSLSHVFVRTNSHGETCVVDDMYTGFMQLDGTSELYSNERTHSSSLCARHRPLEGMSHLTLTCGCAHKL